MQIVSWLDHTEWKRVCFDLFSRDLARTRIAYDRLCIWNHRSDYAGAPSLMSHTLAGFFEILLSDSHWDLVWFQQDEKQRSSDRASSKLSHHFLQPVNLPSQCKRLAYAAVVTRFVNQLVDPLAVSLNEGGRLLGLPQELISLRLLTTHSALPQISELHEGFLLSLQWIEKNYVSVSSRLSELISDYFSSVVEAKSAQNIAREAISRFIYSHLVHNFAAAESFQIQVFKWWSKIDSLKRHDLAAALREVLSDLGRHLPCLWPTLFRLLIDQIARNPHNERDNEHAFFFLAKWALCSFQLQIGRRFWEDYVTSLHVDQNQMTVLRLIDVLQMVPQNNNVCSSFDYCLVGVSQLDSELDLDAQWDKLHHGLKKPSKKKIKIEPIGKFEYPERLERPKLEKSEIANNQKSSRDRGQRAPAPETPPDIRPKLMCSLSQVSRFAAQKKQQATQKPSTTKVSKKIKHIRFG